RASVRLCPGRWPIRRWLGECASSPLPLAVPPVGARQTDRSAARMWGGAPEGARSGGALFGAAPGEVGGWGVGGDASESADGQGLQLSGADQGVARGAPDAEATGGLLDGQQHGCRFASVSERCDVHGG